MKADSKIKKFFDNLKSKKHIEIVIAVIAIAVMLVLYFSTKVGSSPKNKTNEVQVTASDYCAKTEAQLVKALQAMKGVGKAEVVISWESSVETVIAYATNGSGGNISSTPTVIQSQGSSSPIVLKELYPQALGVIIICQGGNDVGIKLDVISAVSVLLNIPQGKINVYAMK